MNDLSPTPISYTLLGDVAVLDLDDGKANAIGYAMLDAFDPALDRALEEAKAVVIAGRPGRFSAGFDLNVVQGGGDALDLMGRGAVLAHRLWDLPVPLVYAVTGHALAMGAVLLCLADYRVGAEGDYRLGLNEVKIGLAVPPFATELARARLNPAHLNRATLLAEVYDPAAAVEAGWLDEVVPLEHTRDRAIELATAWAADLHPGAFKATRRIVRGDLSERLAAMLGG